MRPPDRCSPGYEYQYVHTDKIPSNPRPLRVVVGLTYSTAATAMAVSEYKHLTPEQREHFLQHGWVKIPKAVKEEYLKAFTENVWVRLGYDPEDKSSWTKEKVGVLRSQLRNDVPGADGRTSRARRFTCRGTARSRHGNLCPKRGAQCVGVGSLRLHR